MHMNDVVLALCLSKASWQTTEGDAYLLLTHLTGAGRECPAEVAAAAAWALEDHRRVNVARPNPEPATRYSPLPARWR